MVLINIQLPDFWGKQPWFAVLADGYGVNTPTTDDFRMSTWCRWASIWEETCVAIGSLRAESSLDCKLSENLPIKPWGPCYLYFSWLHIGLYFSKRGLIPENMAGSAQVNLIQGARGGPQWWVRSHVPRNIISLLSSYAITETHLKNKQTAEWIVKSLVLGAYSPVLKS